MFIRSTYRFLVLLLASWPLSAVAQDTARYDALLWRISGNGLAHPSHLYGTMHVSNKVAFHLSEEFFAALEGSDVVALEMDPATWLPQMCSSEFFLTLARLGNEKHEDDLYRYAFRIELPNGKDYGQMLGTDPEAVNDLLFRMTEGGADREESTFLDLFIHQSGRKLGKRVIGLEKLDDAMKCFVKAIMPDTDNNNGPNDELANKRAAFLASGLNAQELTEDAYRAQDLTRMDTLFDYMLPYANARKYLLDERNEVFLQHMEEAMREGAVFTGVGAAHLPGKNGLIAMLRARGYTVEPVHGHTTPRSQARREKLERTALPVALTTRYTSDSLFHLDLPTPLYLLPTSLSRGVHTELSMDNINGAFYSVQRMPTYAGLLGLSQEDVLARIDSVLYESVPGRIDQHKRITSEQGWPGLDVRATTSKGHVIRYRILVSPLEVHVFKYSGGMSGISQKQGQQVFASLRGVNTGKAHAAWSPRRAGAAVDLGPIHLTEEPPAGVNSKPYVERTATAQGTDGSGQAYYLFLATSFPDVGVIEEDTFELHVLAERFVKDTKSTQVSHRDTQHAGRPACFTTCIGPRGDTLRLLTLLHGAEYFLLAARSTPSEADAYFRSFRLLEQGKEGLILHTDSVMQFTTRTATTMRIAFDMFAQFTSGDLRQQLWGKKFGQDRESFEGRQDQLLYSSLVSAEAVSVERVRFHRFQEADSAAFWESTMNTLTDNGSFRVEHRTESGPLDARRIEFLLTDTASSRGIRTCLIMRPSALYTLRACVDTAHWRTAWVDTFFTSFTPTDTLRWEGVFAPKGEVFMRQLTGADTLLARQARQSFRTVKLSDKQAPQLIRFLMDSAYRLEMDDRERCLSLLGELHHPLVLPYLQQMHDKAGDTLDLRLSALAAMAAQRTMLATAAFKQRLLADPPLAADEWRISYIFNDLYDSLPLAAKLFPEIERLVRYPELEGSVRHLRAALTDRHLLPPATPATVRQLLTDAQAELQRVIAASRRAPEDRGYNYGFDEDDGFNIPSGKDKVRSWSNDLTTHLHLLIPHYARPEVRTFFDKAMSSDVDGVELETALLLLDRGHAVDAAKWAEFADRDDLRLWLYRTATELGHPELVPADRIEPKRNADACIFANWPNAAKDSVTFIGVHEGHGRCGSGPVYYYRALSQRNDNSKARWYLTYTGFHPSTTTDPFQDRIHGWEQGPFTTEGIDKAVERSLSDLRYLDRPRWREPNEPYGLSGMFGE